MELIRLSFTLIFHLSLAGDIHPGNDVKLHKAHSITKGKRSLELRANRPRSMDKRSRILKFGKYDHAGRCIFEECDWLGSDFKPLFTQDQHTAKFLPQSARLSNKQAGGDGNHFESIGRGSAYSTKTANVREKSNSHKRIINYHTGDDGVSVLGKGRRQRSVGGKRKRSRTSKRIVKREAKPTGSSNQSTENTQSNDNRTDCVVEQRSEDSQNGGSRLPYDLDGNAYMAFGSLTFLLVILTSAVMYTGLWRKRNTMLYPHFIERERPASSQKTDIKALLKAKLGKIPKQSRRLKGRLGRNRNHNKRYLSLPLVENGEAGLADDESGASGEERISEEEEEGENQHESSW